MADITTFKFQGLLNLTLDRVILHTVMPHSSTSTYIPNFIEIEETFCGRMDGRHTLLGQLRGVDLIINNLRDFVNFGRTLY